MSPDMEQLARRAVACKGWRWMRGMRALLRGSPGTLIAKSDGEDSAWLSWEGDRGGFVADASLVADDLLPDLTDPATLGCLLALVREAWGVPDLHAAPLSTGMWIVLRAVAVSVSGVHSRPTEAAALVAALESAP